MPSAQVPLGAARAGWFRRGLSPGAAPVLVPLSPRRPGPGSFSMARSVHFSVAIDAGSPPPSDLRTGSTSGLDRMRPRKRRGVPMRTPALRTCAPARRRMRLHTRVLRVAFRAAGAAGNAKAGLGATRQSEGLLRVRGRARLRTPAPPPRVAPSPNNPLREGRRAPGSGLGGVRPPNPSPAGTPAGLGTRCSRPS